MYFFFFFNLGLFDEILSFGKYLNDESHVFTRCLSVTTSFSKLALQCEKGA